MVRGGDRKSEKIKGSNDPLISDQLSIEQAAELLSVSTQSELHPLEEGKHAAQSGMDLKAYAEASGKARGNLAYKVMAYRVMSLCHTCDTDKASDNWRNLAEIHAAPNWLWKALVAEMLELLPAHGGEGLGSFTDAPQPGQSHQKGIGGHILRHLCA